jgi:hypothetical protein
MKIAILEADEIAGEVKRADLAATVRQQFVAPNRAFNDLIDVICGLCFSENFGAPLRYADELTLE